MRLKTNANIISVLPSHAAFSMAVGTEQECGHAEIELKSSLEQKVQQYQLGVALSNLWMLLKLYTDMSVGRRFYSC